MNVFIETRTVFGLLRGSQKLVLLRIFIIINAGAYFLASWHPFDNAWANVAGVCGVYAIESCFMLWLGFMRGIGFHRLLLPSATSTLRPLSMTPWYVGMVVLSLAVSVIAGLIVTNMNDDDGLTTAQSLAFFAAEAVMMGLALLQGVRLGWQAVVDDSSAPTHSALSPPNRKAPTTHASKGVKVGIAILLGVMVIGGVLAWVSHHQSNATGDDDELHAAVIDNSPVNGDATPSAASTSSEDITAPTSTTNAYPKGMAQNVSECGEPGYDSNNSVCHPVGQGIADDSTDNAGLPPAINAINDQLAKLGTLSVTMVNNEGYPVFNMECTAQGQCVSGTGVPMGSPSDMAKEMTPVRTSDISKYGYRCHLVCIDSQGNIIGRPEGAP